jgi:hypothetical protein
MPPADAGKQLREAYEALRRRAFPEGSADDDASEFHAELALLDTELNGLIARSLGAARGQRLFGPEDEWRYRDLKVRLEHFLREADADVAVRVRDYVDYLDALWNVVELAKRALAIDR